MADSTPADRSRISPVPPIPLRDRDLTGLPLPVPLTSFVGREREAAAVVSLLRDSTVRLMTLTGPGGVGKTRLALRVAEEAAGDFADGVVFVPLGAVADAALVAPSIAHVLGIRETGERLLVERLTDALRARHLLIVLDNVEHILDAAPDVVALLTRCPRLKVLATGRAPFRRSGEHVVAIPPLEVPSAGDPASTEDVVQAESVRLFAARARAARHDFVLTDANIADVAALVRRLDGLPLAIELAAARIAHLTPAALLARLERRLPLLTGGAPDLPARQRTMAATIAWSHDLLTPEERVLFRRLAVFVGGFALEAAEAVVAAVGGTSTAVLDGIASLVGKSLVQPVEGTAPSGFSEPRYTMLETIREYGLDKLAASGEERDVRRGHAAWCVALAERADPAIWGGPDHRRWLDLLEADLANFRAALVWLDRAGDGTGLLRLAAALDGLWAYRSYRVEGLAWLTRALAAGGDAPRARATALLKLVVLDPTLEKQRMVELVTEAVALRREQGDRFSLGRGLIMLGGRLRDGAEPGGWASVLEEAAALLEPLGDSVGLAWIRGHHGMDALERGDVDGARARLAEAIELFGRDGFAYGEAATLLTLGDIDADRGEFAAAAARYAESLRVWGEVGSREGLIDAIAATGVLAARCGRPDAAARLLAAAARQAEAIGYPEAPRERERRERVADAARAVLGDAGFAAAWAAGRALMPGEAVAEAAALVGAAARTPEDNGERAHADTGLTPREEAVLRLVADGLSDREVAAALFVGPGTVRSHLTSIFGKLGVGSRTAAVAAGRRLGVL